MKQQQKEQQHKNILSQSCSSKSEKTLGHDYLITGNYQ